MRCSSRTSPAWNLVNDHLRAREPGDVSGQRAELAPIAHDRARLHDKRVARRQQPQPQVPVLRPGLRKLEAARGKHRLAPHQRARHAQRIALVQRHDQLVGAVEPRGQFLPVLPGLAPIQADNLRMADADGGIGMLCERGDLRRVLAGLPRVVVVAQRHELGVELGEAGRACRRQAKALLVAHEQAVRRVIGMQDQPLGRSVVDDDHDLGPRVLPEDGVERLGEQRRPAVDGNDDAGAHSRDCAVYAVGTDCQVQRTSRR